MCHSNGRVCASIYQALAHFVGVCLQFDFVELLDGRRLLAQDVRGLEGPVAMQRSLIPITTHDTGFIKYMDSGIWHLAIYNDGKETETVSFLTSAIGERPLRKKTKQNKKTLPPFYRNKPHDPNRGEWSCFTAPDFLLVLVGGRVRHSCWRL